MSIHVETSLIVLGVDALKDVNVLPIYNTKHSMKLNVLLVILKYVAQCLFMGASFLAEGF